MELRTDSGRSRLVSIELAGRKCTREEVRRLDMCADMRVDMCVDMGVDMYVDICMDMSVDKGV